MAPGGASRSPLDRAIAYAQLHLPDPQLTVMSMAAAANISPAALKLLFKTRLRETPYMFIQRRRAELAKLMVDQTDWPRDTIAMRCGLRTEQRMAIVLRRMSGRAATDHARH
ncbi:MAG: helix-turn-helix domain-containing protein [Pseudomonadota bacterium]